jgi:lipid A 4'-phosphatase
MSYLKLRRSQIILGAFALFSLFAVLVPSVDLGISRLFFNGHAFPRDAWWHDLQQDGLDYFLCSSVLAVTVMWLWNRLLKQNIGRIDGRKLLYLLLVLIIGAGLIVNVAFKNHFGRARPRDVVEFNGTREFSPAFVMTQQCRKNCSFSSGDVAAGFFTIALVMLSRRRVYYVAAAAFGSIIALSRLASGAHFFSDTVTSFFVMLIVSDVLYHYMILPRESLAGASLARLPAIGVLDTKSAGT